LGNKNSIHHSEGHSISQFSLELTIGGDDLVDALMKKKLLPTSPVTVHQRHFFLEWCGTSTSHLS